MEEAQILKRGIMRSVSVKARPMLTPLLSRMVGNLDTVDDLEKKIANVKEIVERMLGTNGRNKLWIQVASTDILALRKALRLSQSKFGRLTDATRFSVSNWECIFEIAEHSLANLEHIRQKYRS